MSMEPTNVNLNRRLLVSILSLVVFALLGWGILKSGILKRGVEGNVEFVDHRDEVDDLMARQARDPELVIEPIMRDGVAWPGLAMTKERKQAWLKAFVSGQSVRMAFDKDAYYCLKPNMRQYRSFPEHLDGKWLQTSNSMGMRGEAEPSKEAPDLRVIVTGDSHIEGVCRDDQTFPHHLGRRLRKNFPERRTESFNAGGGGYNLYNYLGALEKFVPLSPDVFVVTVYGGNDFKGAQMMRRYYLGDQRKPAQSDLARRVRDSGVDPTGLNPQEFMQAYYYLSNPEAVRGAIEMMVALTDRMQAICDENDIELICVYLPPPFRGQPDIYREHIDQLNSALAEYDDPFGSSDVIADGWLEFVRERQIRALDLRPIFKATEAKLYWDSDYHINTHAQRLIARSIYPQIAEIFAERTRAASFEGQAPASVEPDSED